MEERMAKHDPDHAVVAQHLHEISDIEPLTADEETRLFQKLRNKDAGDKTSVERILLESQLALVVKIAQKHSGLGVSVVDLILEGNLGLAQALRRFVETPVGDFVTYAANCIEDAIRKALGNSKS